MSPGSIGRFYAPRRVSPLEPVQLRGWMVKRYGIGAERRRPAEDVIGAGLRAVERTLPEAYPTAPSYALGITHEDEDGCSFFVGWWTPNRLILNSRTWLADRPDPYGLREAPDGMTASVWELAVLAHENEAWIKYMLADGTPDFNAYLAEVLSGHR